MCAWPLGVGLAVCAEDWTSRRRGKRRNERSGFASVSPATEAEAFGFASLPSLSRHAMRPPPTRRGTPAPSIRARMTVPLMAAALVMEKADEQV